MAKAKKHTGVGGNAKRPAKVASKKVVKKAKTKLRADLVKEYQERMKKAGVLNVATVSDGRNTVKRWISTQSVALDQLLGGGIPLGKVVEVVAPPHTGKSTTLDHIQAQVQAEGGVAILADTETSRDPGYSARIGVKVDDVQYLEWDENEQYIENVVNAIYESVCFWKKASPDTPVIIGWDALGSTAAQDDLAKGLGAKPKNGEDKKRAAKPGAAAKAMRMAMRQISPAIAGTNIALVILNHEYESVNMQGNGPKRKSYGGLGVAHAASIQVTMWTSGMIKRNDGMILGNEVTALVKKDRIGGHTNRRTTFAIVAGVGIDNVYSIFVDLSGMGVIVRNGSWSAINVDGEQIAFQGWNGLVAKCHEDPTLFGKLVNVYRNVMLAQDEVQHAV